MGRKNRRKLIHGKRLPTLNSIRRENIYPKRMEIWYARLTKYPDTSIQGGGRPVLIVSNDTCNDLSNTVTVLPLTSRLKKLGMPTHVVSEDLDIPSVILAEQITTVDKAQLIRKMGECKKVEAVEKAIRIQTGMDADEYCQAREIEKTE